MAFPCTWAEGLGYAVKLSRRGPLPVGGDGIESVKVYSASAENLYLTWMSFVFDSAEENGRWGTADWYYG